MDNMAFFDDGTIKLIDNDTILPYGDERNLCTPKVNTTDSELFEMIKGQPRICDQRTDCPGFDYC